MIPKIFNLDSESTQRLLKNPETGMGYHLLNGRMIFTDKVRLIVIVNSELIIDNGDLFQMPVITNINDFLLHEERSLNFGNFSIIHNQEDKIYSGSTDVLPPFTYFSKQDEEFIRLSAFKNDQRIKTDGSVISGTYGTTPNDMTVTPSGLAAVGRFALPNRLPATHVFKIKPPSNTPILFGTVTPNFGLCGGGVEVYFPKGCPAGSAKYIGTIPEK